MSKFLQRVWVILVAILLPMTISAQQVTNSDFEDWSGTAFDGNIQPKGWNASNVEQVGMKFNFAHREAGHGSSGYCMMVQDQDVGAMGITETSPGYFSLGHPWVYLPSITQVSQASAGTYGSINWTYRPDSMSVWIKRTGSNWSKEDFYLLYYSWTGTTKNNKFKGKNGSCSTTDTYTDEESDIRIALDGNECGVADNKATQIAEGMWRERAQYSQWTNIRVPIYYMNNQTPQKMNIIFSASNYPNFRANSGLYTGNSLYVDDIQMIYSSKIQKLYIGGIEWKGFDPNSTEVQIYSLGESATQADIDAMTIEAIRGAGSLTNAHGTTVSFAGRTLSGSEITIVKGNLTNVPTKITVKSGDNKSTTVYQIQFQKAASSNAKLAGIQINGEPLSNFSPTKYNYNVDLPYGTTATPVVTADGQEDAQVIAITQPASVNGTATIKVTAANGSSTSTYTIHFQVGLLKDNELQDILVNGKSVPGFTPSQTVYKVSLPVGTTQMPTVQGVSKYPAGEQTIVYNAPSTIDGGQYTISVTTPGNQIAKVYKLNLKLEASSYTYLNDLKVAGVTVTDFQPDNFTYYINLPLGTTAIPAITYAKGDEYQTVAISSLGEGVVDGTVRVTVTAGNGDQSVYKLIFATEKSENSSLNGITIGGVALPDFNASTYNYTYELPVGTTELPEIVAVPGDEFQHITVNTAGLNGKTRITVTAGDGSTSIYMIAFSVQTFSDNTLQAIYLDGNLIDGFDPQTNEYWVNLAQGTTTLPAVTYTLTNAEFQTASVRTISGLTGDYKITIRPQSGASRTYIIHFSVATSSNVNLNMIYVGGEQLAGFAADQVNYTVTLPEGVSKIPTVTFDKAESSQRVLSVLDGKVQTITVTAQNGATRVYTITFIVTVSENAYLEMIYLDSVALPGFVKQTLAYEVMLDGATCPQITVEKAPGQQVTITAPYGAGVAQIKVQPEQGTANIYEITFTAAAAASVRLDGITINGTPIADFEPTQLSYTQTYSGSLPTVEGVVANASQKVETLWKGEVASIHVSDAEGNRAVYTVTFTRQKQSNNALQSILIDGVAMPEFAPATLDYSRTLPAGSTYPEVTYVAAADAQVVFFGQLEDGKWGITVAAEDGTMATYTVTFTIEKYNDATLAGLAIEGYSIAFQPTTTTYSEGLTIDEGLPLPQITATTKPGQTVIIYNVNDRQQKVLVRAEGGAEKTYTINYTRVLSNIAQLKMIYINGKPLADFDPATTEYTITLPHGRKVVPNVFPVGQLDNQTITTTFSRPNGTTTIHVQAQDGVATADYSIHFPVEKSGNTLLGSLSIDGNVQTDLSKTDYEFELPMSAVAPYDLIFEKAEEGQYIEYYAAPVTGVSKIIVHAENGDKRTYSFRYTFAQPTEDNIINRVDYTYVNAAGETVNASLVPVEGENIIDLPFGAKSFTVTNVVKNYNAQTVYFYNGGIRRGAKIIAVANRNKEEDAVYTIVPKMPAFETAGKLQSLTFKGNAVPHFRPDVYNYMVNVTAQPTAADFEGVAYGGATVTKSSLDNKKKQITLTVQGGETYSICWFYNEDEWPFSYERVQTDKAYWYEVSLGSGIFGSKATQKSIVDPTGYKPKGWKVPADLLAYVDYNATVSHFTYYTGHEVTVVGEKELTLSTIRGGALNSSMPGTLTLGGLSFPDGVRLNGNTQVAFEKNLTHAVEYRNTPEQFQLEYQPIMTVNGISQWSAWVALGNASGSVLVQKDITGSYANMGQWQTSTTNLSYSGQVGKLNIMLCASEVSGNSYNIYAGSTAKSCDLQVRNVRFVYNSELTKAFVDGVEATKSGNTFTINVSDEYIGVPALKFTGAKPDQTQTIEWLNNGEWLNGELKAKVVNYGENALSEYRDSTIYTVVLHRNPITSLDYTINFGSYTSEDAGDTVFVQLPYGAKVMPDVTITPESIHQRFEISKKGSDVKVVVTAEDGNSKTTVYAFRPITSNSTALTSLDAEGLSLVSTNTYQIVSEHMPLIEFTKEKIGQTVDLQCTADAATMVITAEDGVTKRTCTFNRVDPVLTTSGQIEEFTQGVMTWDNLGGTKYTATGKRPTEPVLFLRRDSTDAVVFVQTPLKMEWQVTGTSSHTYTLNYPTEPSAIDTLSMIQINGVNYAEFHSYETDYEIFADSTIIITPVASEDVQTITMTQTAIEGGVEYSVLVTAEDGTTKKTYKLSVRHPKSSDATLAGILLDDVLVTGFDPAVTSYAVILPLPADGVKRAEPQMPNITYLAGHKGQTVTVEPGLLGNQTNFTVVSEDATNTKYYDITVTSELSHCVDLTGIMVNGEAINGDKDEHFEPGRHFYSLSLKTSQITVDYTSDDRFQTVTVESTELEKDSKYRYILHVVAEDGVTTADYQVNIYVENKSNDATLANILLDGKKLVDFERALNEALAFDPGQNSYVINLPSGTTVLPEVSAQLKMDGQSVVIDQQGDSVLLIVHAMDNSTNTYVLHFMVPLSQNTNLSMIFLNGEPLVDFDPDYYFYQVTLPVGTHELPEVAAQKAEEVQTIDPVEMDNNKLQATIKVHAEDPSVRENTYVVVFHFTQSDADTLAMIYQDGKNLEGFAPQNKYYAISLPVGTAAFPDLSWEEADDWQTVTMDTVESAADKLIRQIVVTSESGKKNFYTVSYTILKSAIDTLQMIFVDQKQLSGFQANTLEYYYELSASYAAELNGQVPLVEYISGDEYQTVLVSQVRDSLEGKSLGYKSIVTVTAATGGSRTYTIHYPVQKSSEATLNMINLAGKPLPNYDAERFNYKVEIDIEASIPVVTVLKKEDIQVVEININGDIVTVDVTAEDGTTQTYTLTFERIMSSITTLRDIILYDADNEQLPAAQFPYRSDKYSYTIGIDYTADKSIREQLPRIEWITYDSDQSVDTISYSLPNGDIQVDVTVTAPNGEDQAIYSLIFHFLKPTDATLVNILINDEELPGFLTLQTDYIYVHPFGSDSTDFFSAAEVEALLSDSLATLTITDDEEGTIYIRVVAQDGTTEITYIITQTIGKDNNCFLNDLTLDGVTIDGFDSEVTFYTYYLREGATTTPAVDATAASENATVSIREVSAGDTCTIICVAADGSIMRYYVYFAISTVNEALEATTNDVVIKRLPGTNQLFVGTIRKDVYFLLMDQNGHNLFYEQIPTADPNTTQIVDDLENGERLNDISDPTQGLTVEIIPGQIYFYTFLYGDKTFVQMMKGDTAKKLKSGKIICQ